MTACLPKIIGQLLVSFISSSYYKRCPMAPMITQSKEEDDMIWQDALTTAILRVKWIHFPNVLQQFFGMPKFLPPLTKLPLKPEKLHWLSYNGSRCPHKWPYVLRSERNMNISFITCPSCVNFEQCDVGMKQKQRTTCKYKLIFNNVDFETLSLWLYVLFWDILYLQ